MLDRMFEPSTNRVLDDAQANPIARPRPEPGFWSGILTAVPRGVGIAANESARALYRASVANQDEVMARQQAESDFQVAEAIGRRRVELQSDRAVMDERLKAGIDYWKPDPLTTGSAAHFVMGITGLLTKATAYSLATGNPFTGAAATGADVGFTEYLNLRDKGVDPGTAANVGLARGVGTGVAVALPVAGSTLLRTFGLAAAGGPVSYVAENAAAKAILENANYDALADQIDPYDLGNILATSTAALAFGFGVHGFRALKAKTTPAADVPPTDAGGPPPFARTPAAEAVDAALVVMQRDLRDARRLADPGDFRATAADDAALSSAELQFARGDLVEVGHLAPVRDGETAPPALAEFEANILEQLNRAGRFPAEVNESYAALTREFYEETAARLGISPDEMVARYGLRVSGEAGDGANILYQRTKDVQDIRGRTFEEVLARIPEEARVVSDEPRKTIAGQPFSSLDLEEAGPGYLPKADPQADAKLRSLMDKSLAEAGVPDEVRAKVKTPTADELDKMFKLPGGVRYWYELSAEGFTEKHFALPVELTEQLIDVTAATSGGQRPPDQMRATIAAMSQNLRGEPITVGIRDPVSLTSALSPDSLSTLKFGNFSGTMQLIAGLRAGKPLPTIDLQMAKLHGLDPVEVASDPRVYEALALYWMGVRDMQNAALPKGAQPYESWQAQALAWVVQRGGGNPDDYGSVMPDILAQLRNAGIPLEQGKVGLATLMDPRTAEVLSPSSKDIGKARMATVETATSLTPAGAMSAQMAAAMRGIAAPWSRNAVYQYERILRSTMEELGNRRSVEGKKSKQPSVINDLVDGIIGYSTSLSRVDTHGIGTFEGEANPNLRIPMTTSRSVAGQGITRIVLDENQRTYLLSVLGKELKQKAMAASEFTSVDDGQHQTYSVLVKRFDNADINVDDLKRLSLEIGYPLNYSKVPNGWLIDINVGGFDTGPDKSTINQALTRVLGEDGEYHAIPSSYLSDYIESADYDQHIKEFEDALSRSANTGTGREARRAAQQIGDLASARGAIAEAAARQDAKLEAWASEHRDKLAQYESKRRAEQQAVAAAASAWEGEGGRFAQGKRGQISFGPDITQRPSVIALLEDADLSTYLHESGHLFLEVYSDIAARAEVPPDIAADMGTLLAWFEVPDMATWRAMTPEQRRPHHERFAKAFEAYLFEGKAPRPELQGLFERFKAWLVDVYESLVAMDVELTPEVRGVFDRMLGTRAEAAPRAEAPPAAADAEARYPGVEAAVREDGTRVSADEYLRQVEEEAKIELANAELVQVAAECFIEVGGG